VADLVAGQRLSWVEDPLHQGSAAGLTNPARRAA
jgi:hypothetical protein